MAIDHVLLTDTFGHWVDTTNEIIDLINAQLDAAVLANLLTSDKTTLVGAINELFNTKYDKTGGPITGSADISGSLLVRGLITVGEDNAGNSCIAFYDDANNVNRLLCWDANSESWTVEDNAGVSQQLLHTGLDIDLGTFAGLPNDTQLKFKGGTTAENDAYIGSENEITVDTETCALRLHDGTTPGGCIISGSGGGGDINVVTFRDGIDYTAGVDTVLSLPSDPGLEENVFVYFSGVYQQKDAFILSSGNLIFTDPIPSDSVEVVYGVTIGIGDSPVQQKQTDTFSSSGDFTPGTTDQLTLSGNGPGVKANVDILFDAAAVPKSEFSLTGNVVDFNNPIPVGVDQVEITYGQELPVGTVVPPADSVGTVELAPGTPNFLLGFDGSGDPTYVDPSSLVIPFDIDGLPAVGGVNPADLLALSVGGIESNVTAQVFADNISSLLTTSISIQGLQSFTSTGTYVPSAGTTAIIVFCTGGGGGGGSNSNGGNGGTSSFGSFCSATGGTGGTQNNISSTGSGHVAGGIGTGGIINIAGGAGGSADRGATSPTAHGALGGASFWGSAQFNGATSAFGGGAPGGSIAGSTGGGGGAGGTAIDFITSPVTTSVTIGLGGVNGSNISGRAGGGIVVVWEFG